VRRADQYVYGQLVDEAGKVICGATIQVTNAEVSSGEMLTNSSGRFAFGLPRGVYSLRVTAPGYPNAVEQTLTLPLDGESLKVVMVKRAEPDPELNRVAGRVVDEHEQALANVRVTAVSGGSTISTTTDAQGNYTLQLAGGSWQISVSGAGVGEPPASKSVVIPTQQAQIDFKVKRATAKTQLFLPVLLTPP
jgi:hypothetical protein